MSSRKLFVLYDDTRPSNESSSFTMSGFVAITPSTQATEQRTASARNHFRAAQNTPIPIASGQLMADLGSLRPGLTPIRLFSSEFLGLAVTAFFTGFVVTLLKDGYRAMLGEYLRIQDEDYPLIVRFALEWPASFAIFMGFLSDCRPILGRQRKPYMIIGWSVAAVFMSCVAVIDYTLAESWHVLDVSQSEDAIDTEFTKWGGALLWFTLGAAMMLQLVYIATLSMVVEFSQCEVLLNRGQLLATYFTLFYTAATVAQGVTMAIVLPDNHGHVRSTLSVGAVALLLAGACLLPVPFLVLFLDEPGVTRTAHFSVRRRVHELWRFNHQNVVNRIMLFLVVHLCLLGVYNGNARTALAQWCDITEARVPLVAAANNVGFAVILVLWGLFMINWSWNWLAGGCTVAYITLHAVFTAVITYDVSRSRAFYMVLLSILDMPRAVITMAAVIFAIEISDHGREGVILGLIVGLQSMAGVLIHMLSAKMGNWLPFAVAVPLEVATDSAETRHHVMSGAAFALAINLLALPLVLVLPNQKLDAQQQRAVGGFNRYACYAIACS